MSCFDHGTWFHLKVMNVLLREGRQQPSEGLGIERNRPAGKPWSQDPCPVRGAESLRSRREGGTQRSESQEAKTRSPVSLTWLSGFPGLSQGYRNLQEAFYQFPWTWVIASLWSILFNICSAEKLTWGGQRAVANVALHQPAEPWSGWGWTMVFTTAKGVLSSSFLFFP